MDTALHLCHVTADLHGVGSGAARDTALLSGLLIAAAGAGGLNALSAPLVRPLAGGGVAAFLQVDPCHLSVYSFPERTAVIIDIIAGDETTAMKVLDVFVRRLAPASVATESRARG